MGNELTSLLTFLYNPATCFFIFIYILFIHFFFIFVSILGEKGQSISGSDDVLFT